ncbi:hypothetical protein GobsT_09350 [Gemmata obscuriglobus]|uniref:DUF4190 domain-containing protein n=1 Tax=Gemmata obscuriglobus TaxID=114 RepID=A0A2Z3H1A5_9BACT|nr:DUF4190 domain-containing protein [Gemmata obscuriglobus]AWM40549.1 DUF4190 domain-containing protein [Gemmata obscuriglobus]QEG26196.1 hypothetical protein GobsT_09350 [Gemmata obscuriglobus]VTS00875.1 unnamed protein product [Gemmata obscuriglobus UQM 2246]
MDDESEPDDRPRRRRRDEDGDGGRRSRRPPPDDFEPTELLIPGGSPYAIISLYMGLIGLCLPIIGLVFAVPAFICGIVAVRRWKKTNTYGGVTSNIRALLGLIMSGLGVLVWGTIATILAFK